MRKLLFKRFLLNMNQNSKSQTTLLNYKNVTYAFDGCYHVKTKFTKKSVF